MLLGRGNERAVGATKVSKGWYNLKTKTYMYF